MASRSTLRRCLHNSSLSPATVLQAPSSFRYPFVSPPRRNAGNAHYLRAIRPRRQKINDPNVGTMTPKPSSVPVVENKASPPPASFDGTLPTSKLLTVRINGAQNAEQVLDIVGKHSDIVLGDALCVRTALDKIGRLPWRGAFYMETLSMLFEEASKLVVKQCAKGSPHLPRTLSSVVRSACATLQSVPSEAEVTAVQTSLKGALEQALQALVMTVQDDSTPAQVIVNAIKALIIVRRSDAEVQKVLQRIATMVDARMQEFTPEDLCTVALGLVTLAKTPEGSKEHPFQNLVQKIAASVTSKVRNVLTSASLGSLASALSSLSLGGEANIPIAVRELHQSKFVSHDVTDALDAIADAVHDRLAALDHTHIATIAWSYALVSRFDSKVFDSTATSVDVNVAEYPPSSLAKVTWALARYANGSAATGTTSKRLFKTISTSVNKRYAEFTDTDLTLIYLAFQLVSFPVPTHMQADSAFLDMMTTRSGIDSSAVHSADLIGPNFGYE